MRDESDRDGIRVVVELKRDAVPALVQNNLFKKTSLQWAFSGKGSLILPSHHNCHVLFFLFLDHLTQSLCGLSSSIPLNATLLII